MHVPAAQSDCRWHAGAYPDGHAFAKHALPLNVVAECVLQVGSTWIPETWRQQSWGWAPWQSPLISHSNATPPSHSVAMGPWLAQLLVAAQQTPPGLVHVAAPHAMLPASLVDSWTVGHPESDAVASEGPPSPRMGDDAPPQPKAKMTEASHDFI